MHDIVLTVFAVTALLGLVSLLLPLAERLGVPYAVLLAGVGCLLGVAPLFVGVDAGHGILGDTLRGLSGFRMTSEDFVFIFLPALLFETAINVDVRRLMEEISAVFLLAIVGVLISTFVVGFALWEFSGVALLGCLALGAILATTDPVAVIAIFRDIGAPRRLNTLVEGESLFNDAAAIALFALFVGMLTGERGLSPLGAIFDFVQDFAGGIAFGFLAGQVACRILPALRDHRLAETTMTVALSYIVFVIGDHYLGVSGVVAAVTAGLVVGYEGRRRLSPTSWESLARNWEQIGFWASSLIFLLAAMMVPALLRNAGLADLAFLGVLIVAATIARALTLFGLLPLLSLVRLGDRVNTRYKLVILWGGMRGAVSLALALAATENPHLSEPVRQFIGVQATGFVLFTLFVSAPTLYPLMRLLKLDQLSPAEIALRDRVVALSLSTVHGDILRIAEEHSIEPEVTEGATQRYRRHTNAAAEIAEENAQLPFASRLHSALVILVEREQEFYLEYFEARTMSRRAVATLLSHVGWLRDAVKSDGLDGYNRAATRTLNFPGAFALARHFHHYLHIERLLARELASRFEVTLATRVVLRELRSFAERELVELFGAGVGETLQDTLDARMSAVTQAIEALMLQYPTYAQALQTQFLSLTAIGLEDRRYRQLLAESIITPEVFNDLARELRTRRAATEHRLRLDLGLRREDLIGRVDLFATLPENRRSAIGRLMRPRFAYPGERIVRKGDRGETMFFISSGAVEVIVEPEPVRLGSGTFFGEIALLRDQPRNADVVAIGYCQLLSLSRRDFNRLMSKDAALKAEIDATVRRRLGEEPAE